MTNDLQTMPGVGPSISRDLRRLGVGAVRELRGRNPMTLYEQLCLIQGEKVDRCVLYVFRTAVYFAETPEPDPELLLWWRWKNRVHPNEL